VLYSQHQVRPGQQSRSSANNRTIAVGHLRHYDVELIQAGVRSGRRTQSPHPRRRSAPSIPAGSPAEGPRGPARSRNGRQRGAESGAVDHDRLARLRGSARSPLLHQRGAGEVSGRWRACRPRRLPMARGTRRARARRFVPAPARRRSFPPELSLAPARSRSRCHPEPAR